MKLTNFNDSIRKLFLPLVVVLSLALLLLAEYATAEYCCYVGGCSGTDPTCVPCKIMTSCGQYSLCMGYTCQRESDEEGVLSLESVAAEARKLRQSAVEWRKAKSLLDERQSRDVKEHHKKNHVHENVVEDREAGNVMVEANVNGPYEKRNIGGEGSFEA